MVLPDFREFLGTITMEDSTAWKNDVESAIKENMANDGRNTVNSSDIIAMNQSFSINLLEKYHKWLSEKLETD